MEIEIKDFNKLNLGPYKKLANAKRKFYEKYHSDEAKAFAINTLNYEEYRDWRWAGPEHQERTRADEPWFAVQVGGSVEGTGRQYSKKLGRTADHGDGWVGEILLPGINNWDIKSTFNRNHTEIKTIGFQQYRPNDPIGFYAALIGYDPNDYTCIIIPKEVAYQMKKDKIEKTGRLHSAQGTGIYDNTTTEEKIKVLKDPTKPVIIDFKVTKNSNKKHFEYLMDNHRFRFKDVKDYILNFDHTKEIVL